jgi:hypothetical protein
LYVSFVFQSPNLATVGNFMFMSKYVRSCAENEYDFRIPVAGKTYTFIYRQVLDQ